MLRLALWSLLLSSGLGRVSGTVAKLGETLPAPPSRYVVEFDSQDNVKIPRSLLSSRDLADNLANRGVRLSVTKEYNHHEIFTGAVVTLSDPKDIKHVKDTKGVKSVYPIQVIPAPEPVKKVVVKEKSDPAVTPDTQQTHIITGVSKLHAEGITGRGIKVGIVDTGTDYLHPALGGGYGSGYKVSGGYDFVGDNYTGFNTPKPDNDPMDCAGHGTHVAGIVGADPDNAFNVTGVAYTATVHSYRIFGCAGGTATDVIIDALLRAYDDGMDVITMSLGASDGWTTSPQAVVAQKLAARGKIVTVAAGNDGTAGAFYTSTPGDGIGVVTVGSTDNTVMYVQNATLHGVDHDPIPYNSLQPINITGTYPLYATSFNLTDDQDGCNPLPASTPNLTNHVVLIRRGTCSFANKTNYADAFGAAWVLIDNYAPGLIPIDTQGTNATLITAEDGTYLRTQLAAGVNISISFPQVGASYGYPDPTGGLISAFTSYGPTFDMYLKPSIAAPGGNILSTYPRINGSYAVMSGTSMATPYMAGVGALLFEAKGISVQVGLNARTLFQTTGQPVGSNHTDEYPLQTLITQGGGLVDAYKAIHTTTTVSPPELLLNDTKYFVPHHTITVTNSGTNEETYAIGHVPVGTALTFAADGVNATHDPVPLTNISAIVDLSTTSITVGPGSSKTFDVDITQPSGLNPKTLPIYSGYITITSSKSSLKVPYLGAAAALRDKAILDNSPGYFVYPIPALVNTTQWPQENGTVYSFNATDYPSIIFRLSFGTPLLRTDLVDANVTFNATYKRDEPASSVPIVGNLYELDWEQRNSYYGFTGIAFSNLTDSVPKSGFFKILLRVLKVTGDAENEDDYESWLSPEFEIKQ